jgi:ABC-type nitrate/sulfonate/bicarbonate transport system substrate-binding protein
MTASVANMALLGGNVNFISTGSSAIGAIFRGAPLKFAFISFNRPMHWLFSRPEIRDVAGLKGRRIGVSAVGSSAHFLVMEILRRYGLDAAREVTVLGIGTTATRYPLWQTGPSMRQILPLLLTSERRRPDSASLLRTSNRITW